jgi:hypothetical protein
MRTIRLIVDWFRRLFGAKRPPDGVPEGGGPRDIRPDPPGGPANLKPLEQPLPAGDPRARQGFDSYVYRNTSGQEFVIALSQATSAPLRTAFAQSLKVAAVVERIDDAEPRPPREPSMYRIVQAIVRELSSIGAEWSDQVEQKPDLTIGELLGERQDELTERVLTVLESSSELTATTVKAVMAVPGVLQSVLHHQAEPSLIHPADEVLAMVGWAPGDAAEGSYRVNLLVDPVLPAGHRHRYVTNIGMATSITIAKIGGDQMDVYFEGSLALVDLKGMETWGSHTSSMVACPNGGGEYAWSGQWQQDVPFDEGAPAC